MLVFVDESGDCGMNRKAGSSALFVVTAVLFFENVDANVCDESIQKLKDECLKKREFKFNKCCDDLRRKFFTHVDGKDFLYVSFVFNKVKMYGPGFKFKDPFYKYCCKLLFESAKPYLKEATVTIDRSGDRTFRKQLEKYLKNKINTEVETIKKVKTEPSHSNNLLQLADMVCGAVARSLNRNKRGSPDFRGMIRGHEEGITIWPR